MYKEDTWDWRYIKMSNNTFTEKEIKSISKNPYVKAVSRKAITYTNEFKRYFIAENEMGKLPREIFEESGFDIEIVGMDRVQGAVKDDVHLIWRMMKATQERIGSCQTYQSANLSKASPEKYS